MANFNSILKRKKNKDALKKRIDAQKRSKYDDERKWSYELDKKGMAMAILRFLPASGKDIDYEQSKDENIDVEEIPFWTSKFEHGFKNNGKWFNSVCPTTYGDECPVCALNSDAIAATGLEFTELPDSSPVKQGVRNRARKLKYFANVLVVKDPKNPANEGKVFVLEYPKTIQGYIEAKLFPEFEDDESVDVSDFTDGQNFKLKVYKNKKGEVQYDHCEWEPVSIVSKDVKELERIWDLEFCLNEFTGDKVKPDVEEMEKQLNRVMGQAKADSKVKSKPKDAEKVPEKESGETEDGDDGGDSDDDDFMNSLLE